MSRPIRQVLVALHAVRSVAAGTELLAPEVTRRLVRQFMAKPRPGETAPGLAELSERERQVFEHLAGGLSNADIARAMFVSEATVKTHSTGSSPTGSA